MSCICFLSFSLHHCRIQTDSHYRWPSNCSSCIQFFRQMAAGETASFCTTTTTMSLSTHDHQDSAATFTQLLHALQGEAKQVREQMAFVQMIFRQMVVRYAIPPWPYFSSSERAQRAPSPSHTLVLTCSLAQSNMSDELTTVTTHSTGKRYSSGIREPV